MKSHWYDCVTNQVQLGITQKKVTSDNDCTTSVLCIKLSTLK